MLDLIRYLFVCLLFAAAGAGAIRLLRMRLLPGVSWLLGASVTQTLVTLVLALGVILGTPLKYLAIPLWLALFGLAVSGVRGWLTDRRSNAPAAIAEQRTIAILLGVSLIAAPLVMLPYFVYGLADYPGSGFLDGWAYTAFGQYLWKYPRDTEGGLGPIYQFATHLGHTRYISPAELGFLSWLYVPGDTQAPNGLLRALSIFMLGSGCAAFARVRRLSLPLACVYVVISATSGWLINMVWATNYDQGLVLHYFPALAALGASFPALTWVGATMIGALAAAALYTYAEFALFAAGIAGLLAIEQIIASRAYTAIRRGAVAIAAGVLLALPYWHDLRGFFVHQVIVGTQAHDRPGEWMFVRLLDPQARLSGLFALGGELYPEYVPWTTPLAVVLLLVSLLGLWQLLRRREYALLLALAGFGFMLWVLLVKQPYPYGAYKVLSISWWTTSFVIVTALGWILSALHRWPRSAWILVGALALIVPLVTLVRSVDEMRSASNERISQYRVIEQLPRAIGNAPVALLSREVAGSHWGAFFLRDAEALIAIRPGYLGAPHLTVLMGRARSAPVDRIRYVVTDAAGDGPAMARAGGWRLVWGVGRLTAWDTSPAGWAVITDLRDARGEAVALHPYFIAGPPGATLQLLSNRSGTLSLSMQMLSTYGGDPACWQMTLANSGGASREVKLRPGPVRIELPVPAGASSLSLRVTSLNPLPPGQEAARVPAVGDLALGLLPLAASGTDGARSQPPAYTPCAGS